MDIPFPINLYNLHIYTLLYILLRRTQAMILKTTSFSKKYIYTETRSLESVHVLS